MKKSACGMGRLVGVVLAAGMLVSGCAWSVGGRRGETYVEPTQGQELIDLKRALDQGAITPAEYERKKAEIMSR